MTDTDKLKRLAEGLIDHDDCPMLVPPQTILALIAENERLKGVCSECERQYQASVDDVSAWMERAFVAEKQRDEAVALLREFMNEGDTSSVYNDVRAFLARIDGDA